MTDVMAQRAMCDDCVQMMGVSAFWHQLTMTGVGDGLNMGQRREWTIPEHSNTHTVHTHTQEISSFYLVSSQDNISNTLPNTNKSGQNESTR